MSYPRTLPFDAPLAADQFVGREGVIDVICQRLRQPEFLSTTVVGGPRTGKTSLLRYLASSRADAQLDRVKSSIRVLIDASSLGSRADPFDFWIKVSRELGAALRGRAEADAALVARIDALQKRGRDRTLDVFDLEDVFDGFAGQGMPVVLLIDEFNAIVANQNFWPPNDFFDGFRSLWNRVPHGLSMVATTIRPLADIASAAATPSPYYNIVFNVVLPPLSERDIEAFVGQRLGDESLLRAPDMVTLIASASYGHPFLVSYLTSLAAAHLTSGEVLTAAIVNRTIGEQDGPYTSLTRLILNVLTATERRAFETLIAEPGTVTASQLAMLRRLNGLGLLPPGTPLPTP